MAPGPQNRVRFDHAEVLSKLFVGMIDPYSPAQRDCQHTRMR